MRPAEEVYKGRRRRTIRNAGYFIETFLKIKTKDGSIVPFVLNEPQWRLYKVIQEEAKAGKPIRIVILKARQMGFSTLTEALIFHRTVTRRNIRSMIVTHKDDATKNLFKMSKLFYERLPERLRPMTINANAQELVFDNPTKSLEEKAMRQGLGSGIKCATAGGTGVGRSDTIHNLHLSEVAFWTGDKVGTMNGLLQAVPSEPGTMVILESTANGYEDFREFWQRAVRGENDFRPVFFPWFEMQTYRKKYTGFPLSEEEERIKVLYDLDNEQITWRRWCIANNCDGDEELFKQEYPSTPDEAFLNTGISVFDKVKVAAQLKLSEKEHRRFKRGDLRYGYDGNKVYEPSFADHPKGDLVMFSEPQKGIPYVIGADTRSTGEDWNVAQVVDNTTGEQVATLRNREDEDIFVRQLFALGLFYNTALIAPETNHSTYHTRELQRMRYPKMYVREVPDTFTGKMQKTYGFRTTTATRPLLVADLTAIIREQVQLVHDTETLREMLTFIRDAKGKAVAEEGAHDDCVISLGICYQIRSQQSMKPILRAVAHEKVKWTADLWSDYRNADADGKEAMIKMHGNPF